MTYAYPQQAILLFIDPKGLISTFFGGAQFKNHGHLSKYYWVSDGIIMVGYRNLFYLISIDVTGDHLTISFPINQSNKLAFKCAGFQIFTYFFLYD